MKTIDLAFRGSFGAVTRAGELILQRRGVTSTLELTAPGGHFTLNPPAADARSVDIVWSREAGTVRHGADDMAQAHAYIVEHCGVEGATVHPTTEAYMFGWAPYPDLLQDEVLTAVCYEPYSDTVRHIISNVCLVAFRDGDFAQPILGIDRAADGYRATIDEMLKKGFHDCDRKRGDDYCKRRLAWLIGVTLLRLEMRGQFVPMATMERKSAYAKTEA